MTFTPTEGLIQIEPISTHEHKNTGLRFADDVRIKPRWSKPVPDDSSFILGQLTSAIELELPGGPATLLSAYDVIATAKDGQITPANNFLLIEEPEVREEVGGLTLIDSTQPTQSCHAKVVATGDGALAQRYTAGQTVCYESIRVAEVDLEPVGLAGKAKFLLAADVLGILR